MAKLSLGLGKIAPKVKDAPVETRESLYQKACAKMEAEQFILQKKYKKENFELAAAMFEQLGDYEDASRKAAMCRSKVQEAEEELREETYERALHQEKQASGDHDWKALVKTFEELGDYKDAGTHLKTAKAGYEKAERRLKHKRNILCGALALILVLLVAGGFSGTFTYLYGRGMMLAGVHGQARLAFEGLGDYRDSRRLGQLCEYLAIKDAEDSDIVTFSGQTWRILERSEGKATLILTTPGEESELRAMAYHEAEEPVTWETCALRRYLNTSFLEEIKEEQQGYLVPQQVRRSENTQYGTAYEEAGEELVTILSAEEAEAYAERLASVHADMWLRTPGAASGSVAFRSGLGEIIYYGLPAQQPFLSVFPVICLDYESAAAEG